MQTILVVDDSEQVRALYRRMFGRVDGVRLVELCNEREALAYLDTGADVAVVLLALPIREMDGFACFDALRRRGAGCPPIIIVASGGTSEVIRRRLAGGVAFFEKPFSPAELKAAVLAAAGA